MQTKSNERAEMSDHGMIGIGFGGVRPAQEGEREKLDNASSMSSDRARSMKPNRRARPMDKSNLEMAQEHLNQFSSLMQGINSMGVRDLCATHGALAHLAETATFATNIPNLRNSDDPSTLPPAYLVESFKDAALFICAAIAERLQELRPDEEEIGLRADVLLRHVDHESLPEIARLLANLMGEKPMARRRSAAC